MITSLEENKGRRHRLEEDCESFRDTINELILVDITLGEGWFTWNNKRIGDRHIDSHLVRFFVSESIMYLGSELHSTILPGAGSDHWLVELILSGLG